MKEDLRWLAINVEWPSDEINRIGLDPDGEVRFGSENGAKGIEFDFYPTNIKEGLTKDYFLLQDNKGYTKEEFISAQQELKNDH